MTALIVTESIFGNTLAIATAIGDAMAATLGDGQVKLVHASQAPLQLPTEVRLVVVGAPTHTLSLPNAGSRAVAAGVEPEASQRPFDKLRESQDKLRERQDKLRDRGPAAEPVEAQLSGVREWLARVRLPREVQVATFDTSIPEKRPLGTAARAAAKVLRQRGIQTTVGPSFDVTGMEGPLADGELGRATAWGRELAGKQLL